mmetsp:Transcript_59753/g.112727  ORF Transcript_59753/g.112727 Transcript_59753/m.112727 type:complete len:494 (-) Transcript_59753:59-1540(-)
MSRTRFLEEQIAPPAGHNGDDPANGIPWDVLKSFATGCEQDYLPGHTDGSTLREVPGQVMNTDMADPVQALKDGVPVLYFDEDYRTFDRRVLKADDELHFIYVLVSTQGKTPTAPLMSVPLSHVRQVYVMDEALHICEEHGVHDHNLKLDSTVVVYYDMEHENATTDLEQEMPPLSKLFILMAAPQQQLPRMIAACTEQLENKKAHRVFKQNARRVDQVALQDLGTLYDRSVESYGFNVTFRNDNNTRELNLPGDRFEGIERDSLERLLCDVERKLDMEYRILDVIRVMYVLRDAAFLRRSVTFLSPDIFQNRLDLFVRDTRNIDKILPADEAFRHTCAEVDNVFEELQQHRHEDDRRYTEASSRAVLLAMKQLLQLEGDHARIEKERTELDEYFGELPDDQAPASADQPPGETARSEARSSRTRNSAAASARSDAPRPDSAQAGDSTAAAEKTHAEEQQEGLPEYGDAGFAKRNCRTEVGRQCGGANGCTLQ